MKRLFPDWLRRLDPLLAAEDTNPLFEAVRRHELRRRRRFAPGAEQIGEITWFVGVQLGRLMLTVVLLVLTVVTVGLTRRWLQQVARELNKPHRLAASLVPARVDRIFGGHRFAEQVAVDLWLAGLTGREVLEALYLEQRREWVRTLVVIWTLIGLVLGVATVTAMLFDVQPEGLWRAAVLVTAAFLLDTIARFGKPGLRTQETMLDTPLHQWASAVMPFRPEEPAAAPPLGWWARVRAAAKAVLGTVATLLLLAAFYVFALGLMRGIAWAFEAMGGPAVGKLVPWCLLAVAGAIVWGIRRGNADPSSEDERKVVEERFVIAEYQFNLFMSVVVVNDEDGFKWAEAAYPEGFALHDRDPEDEEEKPAESQAEPGLSLRQPPGDAQS